MKGIRTICLNGLEIAARIGINNFERDEARIFRIDLSVSMPCSVVVAPVLMEETFDYSVLLAIVQEEMELPDYLLESVVNRIAIRIHQTYPLAISASIHLQKKNPPLDAAVDSSSVRLELSF